MRKQQYVVVRSMSTSGPFVVEKDGYISGSYYTDMFGRRHWQENENTCRCGDKAETSGHFTNKRAAQRHASQLNRQNR